MEKCVFAYYTWKRLDTNADVQRDCQHLASFFKHTRTERFWIVFFKFGIMPAEISRPQTNCRSIRGRATSNILLLLLPDQKIVHTKSDSIWQINFGPCISFNFLGCWRCWCSFFLKVIRALHKFSFDKNGCSTHTQNTHFQLTIIELILLNCSLFLISWANSSLQQT